MADFPAFLDSVLSTVAAFLWQDSTKWIVACIVLLMVVAIVKRLIRL